MTTTSTTTTSSSTVVATTAITMTISCDGGEPGVGVDCGCVGVLDEAGEGVSPVLLSGPEMARERWTMIEVNWVQMLAVVVVSALCVHSVC